MLPVRVTGFLLMLAVAVGHGNGAQRTFATPEQAAKALLAAVSSGDYHLFLSVAGSRMAVFWNTGDDERDAMERSRILDAARTTGVHIRIEKPTRRLLFLGYIRQPFPAPLIKSRSGWRFDDAAGSAEFFRRQIARNEAAIHELARQFLEAQHAYRDAALGGRHTFALRICSTPGQRDGLFWIDSENGDESPLGPRFAAAAFSEAEPGTVPQPLFGYFFQIRPGGSNNPSSDGFSLIAWPAKYGVDGRRSFLINHSGEISQTDLGPDTARIVQTAQVFGPGRGWSKCDADR